MDVPIYLYSSPPVTDEKACYEADIITPNLTEFCLLAEADYNKIASFAQIDQQLSAIRALGQSFCQDGPRDIVVTGINFMDANGTQQVATYI